ncbi:PD-(D/E)XK motif protein [Ruicaihuangia caeni]|uniref:PD-(D/E)XK motif protein n=1 Tax=Ruicaihuangia caeni TaxID=3042517 RepID=A0AAW6T7J2_9MICO|nr:PD-(D/E)XK motif protein [Klugiella sp. YN-L-19]MDI2098323.1 PD-(D/E)XK motif protein [Klugiella sp. YN-L-19]
MSDIAGTAEFILEAFHTLGDRPLGDGALDARRVPDRHDAFVAVSAHKERFVLFEVDQETFVDERRLKALHILTGDNFTIVDAASDEVLQRRFAMVALRRGNDDLLSSFAVVAAALLSTLADNPTSAEIVDFLDSLADLVAQRGVIETSTVTGLWGELWLIASAEDPTPLATAWHSTPGDRFDFSLPSARIEVKTTAGSVRNHEFALDQLAIGDPKTVLVASLAIADDPSGRSVIDLLESLLQRLPGPVAARVNRIALRTLAGDIESAEDFTFATIGAEPFLAFAASDVPRPLVAPGSGITSVRFRCNLDALTPVARSLPEFLGLLS